MIGDDRNMTFIPQINIYLGSVMMYSVFFMQLLERLWETNAGLRIPNIVMSYMFM